MSRNQKIHFKQTLNTFWYFILSGSKPYPSLRLVAKDLVDARTLSESDDTSF